MKILLLSPLLILTLNADLSYNQQQMNKVKGYGTASAVIASKAYGTLPIKDIEKACKNEMDSTFNYKPSEEEYNEVLKSCIISVNEWIKK